MRYLGRFCVSVVFILLVALTADAETANPSEIARRSTVYIFFAVTDPNTGAKEAIQGTGFVISQSGYVLTASHLFRNWRNQRDIDKQENAIRGTLRDKPGFTSESPLILDVINFGDPANEDVALLKLPESGAPPYPTAPICLKNASKATLGDQLTAYGFPKGHSFQPVPATLGTPNARGGRWAATSAFTYGMSGGPVYKGGRVIGLIKGGLENTDAVNWITPIGHAANFLNSAVGFLEDCGPDPKTESATSIPPSEESGLAASDSRGALAGFTCDVNSYGREWAKENREKISKDLYSLYGCSISPSVHMKPGFRGNFHTSADSRAPWAGLAARSTVFYYHSDNKQAAEALAQDLSNRYGHKFEASKGGGRGVLPEWYQRTIIVHLREKNI